MPTPTILSAWTHSSAERQARSAVRWLPWSGAGWQALAVAQVGLHDRAGAGRSLRKGIAKDPNDWVLWLQLVGVSSGSEQKRAVDRAYALDPLDPTLVQYVAAAATGR